MTRTLAGLCAATALGFVATVGAQAPPPQTPPPTQPPATAAPPTQKPASPAAGNEVKVTGCLAKEGAGFVLNSAMVDAPAPTATGTAGTAGAAGAAGAAAAIPANIKSATSFRVQGTGLDEHIGKRVEVTGAATAAAASSAAGAGAAGAAGAAKEGAGAAGAAKEGAAAAAGAAANAPTLNAKSVRMVSEKC